MYRIKALILSKNEPPAVLLKTIKKIGMDSRCTGTAEAAIELVHKKAYKLVCIDMSGFGMDILEMIERIAKIKQDIVVIGIIPRNKNVLYTKLMKNGMYEVLQKPLRPLTTAASLRRAIHLIRLYRTIDLHSSPDGMKRSETDRPVQDKDVDDLGLDELIKKKLSVLLSRHPHRKITNLYPLVMPIVEKSFLETALKFTKNNQVKASVMLGINRNTFKAKMTKLDIKKQ